MAFLPDDNLSFSTLLSIDGGKSHGSGFRMKFEDRNYLITAKHVLYTEGRLHCETLTLTCPTSERDTTLPLMLQVDLTQAKINCSPTDDVAVILIGENYKTYEKETPLKDDMSEHKRPAQLGIYKYVTVVQQGTGRLVSVDLEGSRGIDAIRISNDVFLMGYPISLALKNDDLFDYTKPLLRKGIIAGIYAKQNTFIIDCPTYYGNSGGPVVEYCEDGYFRVIGLVSRFIPFQTEWFNLQHKIKNSEISNSGYTICVPMNAIENVLRSFK